MPKKILVLGCTGMLGHGTFSVLSKNKNLKVYGTLRNANMLKYFDSHLHQNLHTNIDILDNDTLINIFEKIKPDVVINCIGLIKQLKSSKEPLSILPINSLLPHRLAKLCNLMNARLIHISTDCVFSGKKGNYTEDDISDAQDLYGKSKYIGEVGEMDCAITLRTSIIGHELQTNKSLIDWFLSQEGSISGYTKAIYSGFPVIELVNILENYVIPNEKLHGLYHLSSDAIDKYSLLKLVAETYDKKITINPNDEFVIDRSLNSTKFQSATGYKPPSWPDLILKMRDSHV